MNLIFPNREFEGHIFDCDGTVVDSMPLHYRAWTHALEAHQAPYVFTELRFYALAGMTEVDVVAKLNAEVGGGPDPRAVVTTKKAWFEEHIHELKSVPVIEAIIRKLAAAGTPIAVASGSERVIVVPELEVIGLRDFFEVIITPELVKRGKPAPDLFLLAAEQLGVKPENCLVYEDGKSGLIAAEAAGMCSVFVPTAEERLRELAAEG